MNWRSTIKVPADIQALSLVSQFVVGNAQIAHVPEEFIQNLELAADESSTNVIFHSYKNDSSQFFSVICSFDEEMFYIEVADKGIPFNINQVKKPDIHASLEDRNIGGLGLHFIRTLMDSIEQKRDADGTNRLIMGKKIKS